jgi:non-ribosomal peptide synthetase-like protein
VTIQTGAYLLLSRWSAQGLHVGPIQLESRCKIGMRATIAGGVTVGRGSWICPFVPILGSVESMEIWDGAPASRSGRCTDLRRTAATGRDALPRWPTEALNILLQVSLDLLLIVAPTSAIAWFAKYFIFAGEDGMSSDYFKATPLQEILLNTGIYAFITSWGAIVVVSVLICVFIRATAATPGLYPSRGLKAALLMYRLKKMNQVQRQWTWTITGQYLRALAGLRFTRLGASECDLMTNLVPELASADAQVFWSHGCFTNMLDYDARHITLRQLDMPLNFFAGNNCVAESGHFPSNFLLGVSTAGDDIRFRRQMRSRPGESITVAGNPPVRFASADFEGENEQHRKPSLQIFLARVLLNDVISIGVLRIANVLVYVLFYIALLRMGGQVFVSVFIALVLAGATLVLSCIVVKLLLVGKWGSAHSAPFWSWRHFSYFFAQDCFFAWCKGPLGMLAGTLLSNPILRGMGCRIGSRTIVMEPMQASDWNAVKMGDDCVVAGFLQFHTFENMLLKVKRTDIQDGSVVNFGATVMGGAIIEADTTLLPASLVLKEMRLTPGVYQGSPVEIAGHD